MVMATARTPKDENVENRLKSKAQPSLGVGVASITLLSGTVTVKTKRI